MYPNVNKHIGAESRPQLSYTQSNQVETGRIQVEQVKVPKEQARLSAPPPYSEEDPIAEQSEKGEKVSLILAFEFMPSLTPLSLAAFQEIKEEQKGAFTIP
jgi:hypothetical protein